MNTTNEVAGIAELLDRMKANFTVSKRPVLYQGKDGICEDFDNVVIARDDTDAPLSVMGVDYNVVQNHEFADTIVKATELFGLSFVGGGLIKGGKSLTCTLSWGEPLEGFKNRHGKELFQKRIRAYSSHCGRANFYKAEIVRMACLNTCTVESRPMMEKFQGKVGEGYFGKLTHKGDVERKLQEIELILSESVTKFETAILAFKGFAETNFDRTQAAGYFKTLTTTASERQGEEPSTRVKNIRAELLNLYERGRGNHGETLWDAFNAVTEHVDHHHTKRDDLFFLTDGGGAKLKDTALNLAVSLV